MSDKIAASFSTLPIEVLRQIFEDLDAPTIVWSIRNVCQRFRAAVDIYHRYTLDLTSVSKQDFRQLLGAIPPERVIRLKLSNRNTPSREVHIFRSLVNIDLFTRLRSLTLLNIEGASLYLCLQHARRCSLTSLTFRSRINALEEEREIAKHLSPIIEQLNLVRLEIQTSCLSMLMNPRKWPNQPKLRHLTIAWNSRLRISKILDCLPNLTTLVLNEESVATDPNSLVCEELYFSTHSRLTSLTISNKRDLLITVQSLLKHTPSLTYLKITGARDSIIGGSRWEELIKTKLPALNQFEFHQVSVHDLLCGESSATVLNQVICPFRTPFWTEEKRWLVIANWHPVDQMVEIYTTLVCTPNYRPSCRPKTITLTNFDTQGQYHTKYEDVLRLQLGFCGRNQPDNRNQLITNPLFPNVSELSVAMDQWNSVESVPPGLDLSNVTQLTLSLSSNLPEDEMVLAGLNSLLRQTPNIHSLEFSGPLIVELDEKAIVQICLAVINYVDPSKLRYLTIPVADDRDVRKLLEQFRDLYRIKFDLRGIWVNYGYGYIVKYLRTLKRDYSIEENESSLFIQMCRRTETTNVDDESNSIHHQEAPRLFSSTNERADSPAVWETDSPVE